MNGLRQWFGIDRGDRRAVTRLAHAIAIIGLSVLGGVLHFASDTKRERAAIEQLAQTWRASEPRVTEETTLERFAATWRAQRATSGGQTTLSWSVADARELRAALLAFDDAQQGSKTSVARIDVSRREGGFLIVAEITQ